VSYNRPGGADSSGGDSGLGPALPGGPDPRDPQLPPGVRQVGKSFAPRPELIAKGYRGGDPVLIGPNSEQWTRGQSDVWAKHSYTLADVSPPRRRRPK
jgi:hypothetical protein